VGYEALKDVRCPQCGSWERTQIVREGDSGVVRCAKCHLMFSSPQRSYGEQSAFFKNEYNPSSPQAQYSESTARARRYVFKTTSMLPSRQGKWLDVGCGAGVLLSEVEKAGCAASGFEVHAPYERVCGGKPGWDVRFGEALASAGFASKAFDVVSVIDTLNYIADPIGELRVINGLLRDDGILLCVVPNSPYLLFKNTGILALLRWGTWSHMHTREYLIHFTSRSLRRALESAGFTVIKEDKGQCDATSDKTHVVSHCQAVELLWHQAWSPY
jgi:SAM-dependent methyltransferase